MFRTCYHLGIAAGIASALAVSAAQAQQLSDSKLVSIPANSAKTLEELHAAMEKVAQDKKQPDYAVQKLYPVGGSVALPRGWVLYEQHNEKSYVWLATRTQADEKTRAEARMRIALRPSILKAEKRKASLYVAGQVSDLVGGHPEVKACEPTQVGPFTKVCYEYQMDLQPDSPPFRVRTSFYYSDALDVVGITLFSARGDKWDGYKATMAKMDESLEFFDMKKYGSQPAAGKAADKPGSAPPTKK